MGKGYSIWDPDGGGEMEKFVNPPPLLEQNCICFWAVFIGGGV